MLWNLEVQYLILDKFNIKEYINIKSPLWHLEGNVDLNIGAWSCKNTFIIYREFVYCKMMKE